MKVCIAHLRQWRPGAYARDGLRIFGWLLLRATIQAVTVVLLARWLRASGYGEFIAALAVASFFTPLAGLGLGGVLLVRGAQAPGQLPALHGRAMRLWAVSSALVVPLAVAGMAWSLPGASPLWALAALAVAEVAVASWVELVARAAQARQQAHRFGAIQAGLPLSRLVALGVALPLAPANPSVWMLAYAAASLLYGAALSLIIARPKSTRQATTTAGLAASTLMREGLPYATGALSVRLQAEFNKPVLAHLDYAQAGALSVAQRVVEVVTLPLVALQEALWPRVFAAERPIARILRTGGLLALLALCAGGLLVAAAPFLPWLLGAEYAQASDALVWLALLPAVQLARNLGNAALIAQGKSQRLTGVYVAGAASGVLLALALVPSFGLSGAVWAAYGSEGVAIVIQLAWMRESRRSL